MASTNSSAITVFSCRSSALSRTLYVFYTVAIVACVLPLYAMVIGVGVRRRRAASHTDVLTFHLAVVEACGALGALFYTLSYPLRSDTLIKLGTYMFAVIFPGQTLLHVLTCAERYLAVVHAVAYARLRERGARIRDACVACVWLACALWLVVTSRSFPEVPTEPLLALLAVCMLLTCFCSLAVLRALIGPQPGGGAGRGRQRVLHMVAGITALLALRFVGMLVTFGLEHVLTSDEATCALMDVGLTLSVPSSLLPPLLFLRRAGMPRRCCHANDT